MRKMFAFSALLLLSASAIAQLGTYDAEKAKKGVTQELVLIINESDEQIATALTDAAMGEWEATGMTTTITENILNDGFVLGKNYLLLNTVIDEKRHEMTFLSLVEGWKMKKNASLEVQEGAFLNIPEEQILASILIDQEQLRENGLGWAILYCKHIKSYLTMVMKGKVSDETTALKMYQQRTSTIAQSKLMIQENHVDKTLPSIEETKEYYKGQLEISDPEAINSAISSGEAVCITNIVLTGEGKTKHCFKRVFNASTGELLYLADEPALFGKKEGFLVDDLKSIARAR